MERAWAGDTVRDQVRPALELDQGPLGMVAEAAVDVGVGKAVPRERELELRDIPAGIAGRKVARSQDVPREAAEGAASPGAGDAVRRQPVAALEADHGRSRRPSGDPVDRASVDVMVAERHLERRDSRTAGGVRGRGGHEGAGCDRGCDLDLAEAWHHSNEGSAGWRKSLVSTPFLACASGVAAGNGPLLPR